MDNDSVTVNEGATAGNTGTFSDINADDSVTISASLGTITFQNTGNSGSWEWEFPAGDDMATSTVTITADDGQGGIDTTVFDLTVNNVEPTLVLDAVSPINENGVATLHGTVSDPGTSDTFTLEIVWGDPLSPNNTEQFTLGASASGSQSFTLTHPYLDDNPSATPQDDYTISATLTDDDMTTAGPGAFNLEATTFFGGAGDQTATDIGYADGAVYITGNNAFSSTATATSFVLRYNTPTSDGATSSWTRNWTRGTWYGIATSGGEVYSAGWSHPSAGLTIDNYGGWEPKTLVAEFNANGTNGSGPDGSNWVGVVPTNFNSSPGTSFFKYTGHEGFEDVITTLEGDTTYLYAAGGGQPYSYGAYVAGKYDRSGNLLAAATDSSVGVIFDPMYAPVPGGSGAASLVELNGGIYVAGNSGWTFEDPGGRATIWKYDTSLNLQYRAKDNSLFGGFRDVTDLGGDIYAVGYRDVLNQHTDYDFLIQKFGESGNRLWSSSPSAMGTQFLNGVVGIGSPLFAVGYTNGQGAGGEDMVVLEIDPNDG